MFRFALIRDWLAFWHAWRKQRQHYWGENAPESLMPFARFFVLSVTLAIALLFIPGILRQLALDAWMCHVQATSATLARIVSVEPRATIALPNAIAYVQHGTWVYEYEVPYDRLRGQWTWLNLVVLDHTYWADAMRWLGYSFLAQPRAQAMVLVRYVPQTPTAHCLAHPWHLPAGAIWFMAWALMVIAHRWLMALRDSYYLIRQLFGK